MERSDMSLSTLQQELDLSEEDLYLMQDNTVSNEGERVHAPNN